MKRFALALSLALAVSAQPVLADCVATSQNAIALVQITNAYSISRYTWAGDPAYDQGAPECSKTAIREFACNAVVHIAIVEVEKALPRSHLVCALNYAGAAAFAYYTRHAVGVQLFSRKL